MRTKRTKIATALAVILAGVVFFQPAVAQDVNTRTNVKPASDGPDSDGDGIRNQDDLDDDNDGILDRDEGSVDADNDGVHDAASTDTDGDGTPDVIDLDTDNDGILDNLEARLDRGAVRALDRVINGAIDVAVPVGRNGVADVIETTVDSGVRRYALPDVDGDGVPDFRDLDSDGDRIWDLIEAGGTDADGNGRIDGFSDVDGKGVDDTVQRSALPIFETDGDGVVDFRDSDSDGDGLSDRQEAGNNPSAPTDTDGDGAPDYRESDSDGDGIPDRSDPVDDRPDSDGDGIPDSSDAVDDRPDSDGDGIPDRSDPVDDRPDSDGDGIPDRSDAVDDRPDSDGDGIPDSSDAVDDRPNSDGGGTGGAARGTDGGTGGGSGGSAGGNADSDGDGIPDSSDPVDDRPDRDGDGIVNQIDLDDDNDGLLDTDEGIVDADGNGVADGSSRDSDGDGTPDGNDLDSDNDGILDLYEGRLDAATVARLDRRRNGAIDIARPVGANGIADAIETSPDSGVVRAPIIDTDGDGSPDYRDIDSDRDGIVDLIEAGGTDADGDGRIDNFVDVDTKGVDDAVQASALPLFDTDGDGVRDFRDTDSDGDGIDDRTEGGGMGVPRDTDGDGAPDYRETDSDGNGVPDGQTGGGNGASDGSGSTEGGTGDGSSGSGGSSGLNGAGTGSGDDRPDRDGDGIVNQLDLDDDNDGLLDTEEGIVDADGNGVADSNSRDTDGDGTPDGNDLDSDNDGILDLVEGRFDADRAAELDRIPNGAIDIARPVGANGVTDVIETSLDSGRIDAGIIDTDGDGTPDYLDLDSDSDGIADLIEAGGSDADGDGRVDDFVDIDGMGVDDTVQATALPLSDTDGDGVRDYIDLDSDGDSLPDSVEAGDGALPRDTDGDGAADYREIDSDNDGVRDVIEAGGNSSAPADSDGNGIADFQDGDTMNGEPGAGAVPMPADDADGDGTPNGQDADADGDGILNSVEGGSDSDSDGVDNAFDRDSDNDGIDDEIEAFAGGSSAGALADSDGDGVPDYIDLDSDNDSVFDALESDHVQIAHNGRLASAATVDAQGLASGASSRVPDSDGDGVPDYRDVDSDNDGLTDLVESDGRDNDGNGRLDTLVDSDGDGAADALQSESAPMTDTDADGTPNRRDLDSDDDGQFDIVESGGVDANNDGLIDDFADHDDDGLDDARAAAHPQIVDTDGDGVPDQNDPDDTSGGAALSGIDGSGTDGSGCSIVSARAGGGFDPAFGLLLLSAVVLFAVRRSGRATMVAAVAPSGRRRKRTSGARDGIRALVAVGVIAALTSACSTLDGSDNYDRRLYVGAGALISQLEPDTDDERGVDIDDDKGVGGSVTLGYDISDRIAVEGHIASLGEATLSPDGDIAYQVGGLSAVVYGLNDEYDRAMREGWSAFGRLGVGTLRNQANDVEYERINDFHLLAGIGAEYGFENGLAIRGELVAHETDAKYAQLALLYRFGEATSAVGRSDAATTEASTKAVESDGGDDGAESGDVTTMAVPDKPTSGESTSLDADSDGVVDASDRCPETRDDSPVDETGCDVFGGVAEGVAFESGSDRLTDGAMRELDKVAGAMAAYPAIDILIDAHTDNQGSAASNLDLSRQRALAVARYLAARGVDPKRLKPRAFGESSPRRDNNSAAGRAANRRVEIAIVE